MGAEIQSAQVMPEGSKNSTAAPVGPENPSAQVRRPVGTRGGARPAFGSSDHPEVYVAKDGPIRSLRPVQLGETHSPKDSPGRRAARSFSGLPLRSADIE